jgi:hypothetical protein
MKALTLVLASDGGKDWEEGDLGEVGDVNINF